MSSILSQPFRFLNLPAEIQSMIIGHVHDGQHRISAEDRPYQASRPFPCDRSGDIILVYHCFHDFKLEGLLVSRYFHNLTKAAILQKNNATFTMPRDGLPPALRCFKNVKFLRPTVSTVRFCKIGQCDFKSLRSGFPKLRTIEIGGDPELRRILVVRVSKLNLLSKDIHSLLRGEYDSEFVDAARDSVKVALGVLLDIDLGKIEICFSFQLHTSHFVGSSVIQVKAHMIVFDCKVNANGGLITQKWFHMNGSRLDPDAQAGKPAYISVQTSGELPQYLDVDVTTRQDENISHVLRVCNT